MEQFNALRAKNQKLRLEYENTKLKDPLNAVELMRILMELKENTVLMKMYSAALGSRADMPIIFKYKNIGGPAWQRRN